MVQAQQTPLPTMTSGTERILGMMGLSFSMSNELWIKVVRFWKKVLIHHQQQPQQEAAATSLQQVQEKVSYTDILLVNGSDKASLAPLPGAAGYLLPGPMSCTDGAAQYAVSQTARVSGGSS